MALGPGTYDDLCTEAREKAKATGAALIIMDGEKGVGFSVQAPIHLTLLLPDVLEKMAAEIRRDMAAGKL